MQYRAFESSVVDIYNCEAMLNELKKCDGIYDNSHSRDVAYLIFNKHFLEERDKEGFARMDLVLHRRNVNIFEDRFPNNFLENVDLSCRQTTEQFGIRRVLDFNDTIMIGISNLVNVNDHSYYMVFFKISEIASFHEDVVNKVLMHLDMLF